MHDKIKKNGQASMEYIMVLSIIMLVFMMVMYIIYEKNMEIIETKTYIDAKRITNSIVTNVNTISEQGNGYYKTFTIPGKLYRYYDYEIIISANTVELRWGIRPYVYSKSPITANVHGFLFKGLNKVLNCGGEIYVGYPPISCAEALANIPPEVNISHPGTLNCTPFVINGTARDINGTVAEVEVSINDGLWWNAEGVVMGNETNWTYPFTPTGDGTYEIRARAIDVYGAYSAVKTVTVDVSRCSDLIPVGPFAPSVVKTGANVPVSINVKNNGTGSCGSFWVKFDIIDRSTGTSVFDDETNVSGLGAGNTVSVSINWIVPVTEDNYTVNITVDSNTEVNEINEDNNNYSANVSAVTNPPNSTITYPLNIAALNCTKIIINGTASDDNNVTQVRINITGPGGYSNVSGALLNATGRNVKWNSTWTPKGNGNYTICSRAIDNNNYPSSDYCIKVTVSGCTVCNLGLVNGSVKSFGSGFVRFSIINNGSYAQTIDGMIVAWNTSARLSRVQIANSTVWENTTGVISGTMIDIANTTINAGSTQEVRLRFNTDMTSASINVTFILNDSTNCGAISLTAPPPTPLQLNVGRDGWKVRQLFNCTGPGGWTDMSFNDSSWTTVTLPYPNCPGDPGICTDCDFYLRKHINISGTPASASYKFGSDDSMELYINGTNVSSFGSCHPGSGCQGASGCCSPAENDTWKNITSSFREGDNIIAVHVSEHTGREYFDMIFNITYYATQ